MARLLLLFIVVPAVELALLIEVGRHIGTPATLGLIVLTGVVGASLARRQGLDVLRRMREESAAGRIPAGSLVDGVIILIAGALLMTPGILTDAVGFLCLVPGFRRLVKRQLRRRFEEALREGRVQMHGYYRGPTDVGDEGPVYDVKPEPKGELHERDRDHDDRGT